MIIDDEDFGEAFGHPVRDALQNSLNMLLSVVSHDKDRNSVSIQYLPGALIHIIQVIMHGIHSFSLNYLNYKENNGKLGFKQESPNFTLRVRFCIDFRAQYPGTRRRILRPLASSPQPAEEIDDVKRVDVFER